MRRFIITMVCLILCVFSASGFAEEGAKQAETPPENSPSPETDQEIVDQEIAEILEILKVMELLKEMEFIRDYHLFAEEETDETEN